MESLVAHGFFLSSDFFVAFVSDQGMTDERVAGIFTGTGDAENKASEHKREHH